MNKEQEKMNIMVIRTHALQSTGAKLKKKNIKLNTLLHLNTTLYVYKLVSSPQRRLFKWKSVMIGRN